MTLNRGLKGNLGKKVAPAWPEEMVLEIFCIISSTFTQLFSHVQLYVLQSAVVTLVLKWT